MSWLDLFAVDIEMPIQTKEFLGEKGMLMFMNFGIRLEMWDLALRSPFCISYDLSRQFYTEEIQMEMVFFCNVRNITSITTFPTRHILSK